MASNWLYFPEREVLIPRGFGFFREIWTINYKTRQIPTSRESKNWSRSAFNSDMRGSLTSCRKPDG